MKIMTREVTRCAKCATEIGPARIWCYACRSERIDTALTLRSNATKRGQLGNIAALDRLLKEAQVNNRNIYKIGK